MGKRAFKRYFEWMGSKIYIRVDGKDTATSLNDLFKWFHENKYDLEDAESLRTELHALWAKHNRLLTYLELEDITMPERKEIRKTKKRVVRVATKPKKQAKGRKVSP